MIDFQPITTYELITIIISIVALILVVLQIRQSSNQIKKQSEKSSKENFLYKLDEILQSIKESELKIRPSVSEINKSMEKTLEKNPELDQELASLFNEIERISYMVKIGHYDKKLVQEILGSYFKYLNSRYIKYVQYKRAITGNPHLFIESEILLNKYEKNEHNTVYN